MMQTRTGALKEFIEQDLRLAEGPVCKNASEESDSVRTFVFAKAMHMCLIVSSWHVDHVKAVQVILTISSSL
jgi:hypothetical protein